MIHGTASPDGRYAIGLGLARKEINWDDFVNKDDPENGPTYYAENEEDVRNYVVDLEAAEYCAAGDCKGDTKFAVGERLRLRETPKGLRVDILKARRLASESSEE